jgi:tetratricopeptide (TPR) repeat protein
MSMDLLDFEVDDLYFDNPLQEETETCIDQAAKDYGKPGAELQLLRANFLEPEHPTVAVALYRYFYYQHRYQDALLVAERVLRQFAAKMSLPERWQDLNESQLDSANLNSITELRFYLLALKGAGYLEMRLQNFEAAIERLEKITMFDGEDRLGAAFLLETARDELNRQAGIYRLKF